MYPNALQSFDKHVGDALIGGHINQVEGIQSSPVTLQDAFEQCSATLLEGRSYPVVSLPSSDTLAAAIDLCSIGGRPEGEIKDSTRSLSESGKRDEMAFSRCKLYYSIGWLAAGRTGDHTSAPLSGPSPAIDDTDLRSLGLSLNQLSFALLKATQRLSRTVPDAAKIVRQKIEYYAKKTPTVTITDKATNEPMTEGSISVTDETSNLPMTQVTAAAVTYRETRLLCSIAAGGGDASREELMDFWSAVSVVHPSLLGYSTALFELLDAHMGAGNGTGLVQWAMVAVDGGMMLPAMRVKELLVRYANSDTLHCLPSLLPLLAKLGTQQTEGDFDGRPDDAGTSIGTQFAMQRKYAGPSDLSLPLSMAVLRDLCVKLLLQKRLSDASVLLQCVHPVQWPYDELLFALATSIESDSDAPKNEKGNDGRRRECMTVLRRREELSVPVLPIKSATAKALLAMQTETTERTKDSDSESQQSFRIMVARAVKSAASEKRVNVAVDNGLSRVNGDNNNGRIFSIVNVTNTMSESDVRSGLLALLTLYNLTDTVTEAVSEQNSSLNLTPEMQWPSEEKPAGSAGETLSPRTLRWIDPESPENLSKFLSEIESLGGAEATQRQVDAVESGGDVVAIELEGKRMVKMDKIVSNIGLRVSGSKKSWKRGGTFGTSFSQTGSAFPPLQQRASPSLTADESFAEAVESVDILVCKELAQSLLNTVAFQIAAHLKRDADRAIEEGLDLEQQRLEGRKYGASESRGGHGRRMVRDIESRRHTSITGAIRALFSLENQSQADRLFSTFENSDLLCDQLLYLSSLKVDSATAALVVEQMSYQNILLKGSVNDKNTWEVRKFFVSILVSRDSRKLSLPVAG